MKTIIAGSRNIKDYQIVEQAIIISKFQITEVVSGKARGVDTLGEMWAEQNNIHVEPFPAKWDKYGRSAGCIRNEQMAKYADALILVWDGESKGSTDMLKKATKHKLQIYTHEIEKGEKQT